jgi:hypothetical protein
MNRRFIATAVGFAVITLAGLPATAATVCEQKCDLTFQACNGSSPDTSKCLPPWGQCKRACTAPAKTVAAATPKAQVTKVAQTAPTNGKAKPPGPSNKTAKTTNATGNK